MKRWKKKKTCKFNRKEAKNLVFIYANFSYKENKI